ncbi:hypothetical protein PENSUB_4307 [Penicillium subrubescens]|uniref:Xylanolytic transcriptional activator regulatory domain-containing protein n=1 Tax=Penicillium subrubescens TaxID=1316194 RepID=A0A1Q5UR66_9EURO|nr:hypothetical protein PENSUB_4307 [Penicillium subrubescens]
MLTFSHLNADAFENPKKNNGRKRPRVRETVAYNHYRKSKVRCDRKAPYKPCQDRGLDAQCAYSRSKSPAVTESVRPLVSSRSTEVDQLVLQQPAPRSSDSEIGEIHNPPLVLPHNQSTVSYANSAFKGSDFKTRLIGGTHWMAACSDLPVIGAMLEKTVGFQQTWRTFAEVKSLLRVANSVPAGVNGDSRKLLNLLPNRSTCEKWIKRFYETYGRIYHIIDQNCLTTELEEILIVSVDANEVHILKMLLVIAIAMQTDKSERLRGRLILQEAESCIHTSTQFQKPCIGVVQALLLLIIMKTITASDTDSIYNLMGVMGLTTQIALSMGLHRDPALFPGVTPYFAEVRKRLWAWVPSHISQRGDLYEAWDNSVSILYQSQEVLHSNSEPSNVAYPLLWTDIARAALTACLVVGRLRSINLGTTVSNGPPPTLVMFQQLLLKSLESLSQTIAGRYRLGPVAAKTRLVLAVATTVTSNLISEFGDSQQDSKFLQVGIKAAEEVVTEMGRSLKREQQDSAFDLLGFDTAKTPAPISASTFLAANWMDHEQLPDPLMQTLFPSEREFYPGSGSLSQSMQSDLCLQYPVAPFESTATIRSSPNILWEDL